MAKYVLVDTGYWFGYFTPGDQYHYQSKEISETLSEHIIVVPFPSLYEILNTKFIKNKAALSAIESIMKSDKVEFIFDETYRENALGNIYKMHSSPTAHFSLVDCIIREILQDVNIKIEAFVTYNERDFKDVCDKRGIIILP